MGAGVVTARYYGARQSESVSQAVHTTVAFGIVAGVLLTVLGLIYTPVILRLMGTPGDVLPESVVYFRIYFSGSLAFVLYNIFVGILQSVGDSRHPLIYLIISSAVNVALDLLLIAVLGFGVGAAGHCDLPVSQRLPVPDTPHQDKSGIPDHPPADPLRRPHAAPDRR